jgi:hypothetical protein
MSATTANVHTETNARFLAASRTPASSRWLGLSSGSPLSSSRSGHWLSLVPCVEPWVPIGMGPIRCSGPTYFPSRLHLPVPEIAGTGRVVTVLRKIDGASQDRASARVYLALARVLQMAVHLDMGCVRRKPDIDVRFSVSEIYCTRTIKMLSRTRGGARRSDGSRRIRPGRQPDAPRAGGAPRAAADPLPWSIC